MAADRREPVGLGRSITHLFFFSTSREEIDVHGTIHQRARFHNTRVIFRVGSGHRNAALNNTAIG